METKLLKPSKESLDLACKLLKQGEVVGVPTETVYGLAGDCKNSNAVKKIFQAKGRPQDNPLIVHISNLKMLDGIVSYVPEDAKILAKHFWPGPLTMIMPKGKAVCDETCAGLDSVGVRMPSHPVAKELIERSGVPFAAPSANLSGKPSPTTAEDVFADMNGRIPLILDGGQCNAGVESTVLSLLQETPIILRPGVITQKQLEAVLHKKVEVAKAITQEIDKNEKVLSPGMKYKHYSPNAKVVLVRGSFKNFKAYVEKKYENGTFAMCFDGEDKKLSIPSICYGKKSDATSQAHNLFSALRKLDKVGAKIVFTRCPQKNDISLAVYNRLIRSAGFDIIDV